MPNSQLTYNVSATDMNRIVGNMAKITDCRNQIRKLEEQISELSQDNDNIMGFIRKSWEDSKYTFETLQQIYRNDLAKSVGINETIKIEAGQPVPNTKYNGVDVVYSLKNWKRDNKYKDFTDAIIQFQEKGIGKLKSAYFRTIKYEIEYEAMLRKYCYSEDFAILPVDYIPKYGTDSHFGAFTMEIDGAIMPWILTGTGVIGNGEISLRKSVEYMSGLSLAIAVHNCVCFDSCAAEEMRRAKRIMERLRA